MHYWYLSYPTGNTRGNSDRDRVDQTQGRYPERNYRNRGPRSRVTSDASDTGSNSGASSRPPPARGPRSPKWKVVHFTPAIIVYLRCPQRQTHRIPIYHLNGPNQQSILPSYNFSSVIIFTHPSPLIKFSDFFQITTSLHQPTNSKAQLILKWTLTFRINL